MCKEELWNEFFYTFHMTHLVQTADNKSQVNTLNTQASLRLFDRERSMSKDSGNKTSICINQEDVTFSVPVLYKPPLRGMLVIIPSFSIKRLLIRRNKANRALFHLPVERFVAGCRHDCEVIVLFWLLRIWPHICCKWVARSLELQRKRCLRFCVFRELKVFTLICIYWYVKTKLCKKKLYIYWNWGCGFGK